jgi:hypothetical protein
MKENHMPGLETKLHLDMLKASKGRTSLPRRIWQGIKWAFSDKQLYGLEWGDPDAFAPLRFIRDRYVQPYVHADQDGVEIGPGGGRWTRYLLGFRTLYVVDYHQELLDELQRSFNRPTMRFIRNNGMDFPGVPERSIDFLFSFGVFVHLDANLIEGYLKNMKPLLKPGANVVLQYSDKTKIMAQLNAGFADNSPERMRRMVTEAGYRILEEDTTTLWHSSVVRFTV